MMEATGSCTCVKKVWLHGKALARCTHRLLFSNAYTSSCVIPKRGCVHARELHRPWISVLQSHHLTVAVNLICVRTIKYAIPMMSGGTQTQLDGTRTMSGAILMMMGRPWTLLCSTVTLLGSKRKTLRQTQIGSDKQYLYHTGKGYQCIRFKNYDIGVWSNFSTSRFLNPNGALVCRSSVFPLTVPNARLAVSQDAKRIVWLLIYFADHAVTIKQPHCIPVSGAI